LDSNVGSGADRGLISRDADCDVLGSGGCDEGGKDGEELHSSGVVGRGVWV